VTHLLGTASLSPSLVARIVEAYDAAQEQQREPT